MTTQMKIMNKQMIKCNLITKYLFGLIKISILIKILNMSNSILQNLLHEFHT
jgi:hypothetical protein